MRELTKKEVAQVSGGFAGTPIPFTSKFIPAPNWPGGFPNAIAMGILSFRSGFYLGTNIYNWITSRFGYSPGAALYLTIRG